MQGLGYNCGMTCIIGIAHEGHVYIGGDRSASDGESIVSLTTPKVYIRGDWIFAYSGSLGSGQLMQCITIPDIDDQDPFIILRMDIVEALKSAIDTYGTSNEEHAAEFLIGSKGRLFELSTADWGVAEVKETSLGSGGAFAMGSLHTTSQFPVATPLYRIEQALDAAITYSPTCQGPIDILML